MKNWSKHIEWYPRKTYFPKDEQEIVTIVQDAIHNHQKVRVIGSGHSFTPLSQTEDYLISLDHYRGIISVDQARKQVTVRAGTKLCELCIQLKEHGLALENMGDINVQSIAGAISTGTHGTGLEFGNLSTQLAGLRMINGLGEIIMCSPSENPELFKAAQVSMGLMGIITELTIQCVDAFNLKLEVDKLSLESVMQNYSGYNRSHRHFEFYWFPNTKWVMVKKLSLSPDRPKPNRFRDYVHDIILENKLFKFTCDLSCLLPGMTRTISQIAANTISHFEKTDESFKVFSTERRVRFNEMEYNIPLENYEDTVLEMITWINRNNSRILFPIENRFVKGDDIFLSPAYRRNSAYIAIHTYHKKDFSQYFEALESIFRNNSGRPHWGKIHHLTFAELSEIYPAWSTFMKIRVQQDPHCIFVTPYFGKLLNIDVSDG